MKLRIEKNAIRLRLTRAEIDELAEKGHLEVVTPLGPGQALRYRLEAADVPAIALAWNDACLTVRLPAPDVAAWPKSGQIGFQRELDAGDGLRVSLRVERDFKEGRRPARPEGREEAEPGPDRFEPEDRTSAREEPSD